MFTSLSISDWILDVVVINTGAIERYSINSALNGVHWHRVVVDEGVKL